MMLRSLAVIPCVLLAMLALPTRAADGREQLRALAGLQPGSWVMKSDDTAVTAQRVCLGDPRLLLQLQRRSTGCSRYVVKNDPSEVTIHDTCPGSGHARTTVRVETPRLVQVDSQGIADNSPFAWTAEGRWAGQCAAGAAAR